MKTITLRDIPPRLLRLIRERARKQRISANRAVLSMLEDHLPRAEKNADGLYHDLDHMAGSISDEEAALLLESLAAQRTIDQETWK